MTALRRAAVTVSVAALLMPLVSAIALAAGNTVPGSKLGRSATAITPTTLKPATCSAISVTTLVTGTAGTAASELLLATAAANTITAAGGSDCVLGGGGNDSINCGAGVDVAIGGPGVDTFNANCETQIQ